MELDLALLLHLGKACFRFGSGAHRLHHEHPRYRIIVFSSPAANYVADPALLVNFHGVFHATVDDNARREDGDLRLMERYAWDNFAVDIGG